MRRSHVVVKLLSWLCIFINVTTAFDRLERDLASVSLAGPLYDGPKDPIHTEGPPYLWALHDFLTREQCAELIQFCQNQSKFEPSPVGIEGTRGTSGRNSSTCMMNGGTPSPLQLEVIRRAAIIAGVTPDHVEPLQMVEYFPTQWYNSHHDWFTEAEYFPNNRYVTMLVYLNDDFVGGRTLFPNLNKSVSPRVGSAAFWYNCWQRPGTNRTTCFDNNLHQGSPPTSGVKYALNIWISMFAEWETDRVIRPVVNADGTRGVGTMAASHSKTPGTHEIDVDAGEEVWMFQVSANGWAEVFAPRIKKRGWVPRPLVSLGPAGTEKRGVMTKEHTKTPGTNEIDVLVNDEVFLYKVSPNQWAEVYAPRIKKRGWVPLSSVEFDDYSATAQVSGGSSTTQKEEL